MTSHRMSVSRASAAEVAAGRRDKGDGVFVDANVLMEIPAFWMEYNKQSPVRSNDPAGARWFNTRGRTA